MALNSSHWQKSPITAFTFAVNTFLSSMENVFVILNVGWLHKPNWQLIGCKWKSLHKIYPECFLKSQGKISAKHVWFFISTHQAGNYKVMCFDKICYVKICLSAILKLERHKTYFSIRKSSSQVSNQSKQEMCVISFYIFTLPFLKNVYIKWKKFVQFVSHKKLQKC